MKTAVVIAVSCLAVLPPYPKRSTIKEKHNKENHARKSYNSAGFFKLDVKTGEKLGNIFSRTISYKSADFPEIVFRAGGTGVYTVINNSPLNPVFDGVFRYDGRAESHSKVEMHDNGKTVNYDGTSMTNTDGSGVLYNSLIWGIPPAKISEGNSWKMNIPQAWELGGAGEQTITVLDIDAANHTVRLKREGEGDGFYDNDRKRLNVTRDGKVTPMDIAPGRSHWVGYTTFKNGLIISDELMVKRSVTLTSADLRFTADQREYILLNSMPVID
ncbi:hypothetical protein [Mucilaginibacter ginsenosidivorans]|uniref:Uncharacterized protein n=1 Tax=Mucilaginibacter ginsenosidivorans TaxID=398053 RepID=A0A5B8UUP4_9SPHI|nr:hypothetical protein [Mucilaginibacter ginsenosidivorans]QEC62629.1 hypothetical protein FRZ54_08520 [Mucilaginibacter ginsenosidivorans]